MTGPPQLPRRSLRLRLAISYAAATFAVGVVVLAVVTLPLAGVQSTTPVRSSDPATITGTGDGIGPRELLVSSALALVLLVPLSSAVGWFVAGRFLRPLREITTTARAISVGNLHRRLGLGEPADELTELGSILDDLFARLEASFTAQRHFVANASHELRTPLAGLRTLLEVTLGDPDADAETLRSACREALVLGGHQERLVRALLALATSERGVTRWDTLDLAQVVAGVLASRRDHPALRGVDLTEHLLPAMTAGDPGLVESLVANLVDNAVRHNHPDGHVEIGTRASGTEATLTVVNSGPVVPADQVPRLLQPFQRLGSARNGLGLGLAIVEAVARAHHATLAVGARPEGGLSITVRFAHSPPPVAPRQEGPPSPW
jgi:signal transduction histidine kinase